ncbi:conjugative transfer signal peptidase TraF [Diaphorobacter nitroreducens]|uniref:conjugative transfer signal peptidase TraF n=1 Tax=Diaphorobacter nitroreducens TaxID=164759 RepID=UPI000DC73EE4|nr:conjugative transfer signal peptidase TraF [Diaphorobacter nitroreducens]ASI68682.1 conjugative transfer signal peptidase TraF [Diaphorobacter nitroreducens]
MTILPLPELRQPAPRPRGMARLHHASVDFLQHMRRRWYFYLPIFGIWALAYLRLFFDATPRVPVLFNWTPSLPYKVALLHPGQRPLHRGEFIVFSFAGDGVRDYPGLAGQPFFKIVRGMPGDTVTVQGREVRINGEPVGIAKTHAFDRRSLDPIAAGVIPPGHLYVQGLSPDSFDSRYRQSGLVRVEQVIGVVDPIF